MDLLARPLSAQPMFQQPPGLLQQPALNYEVPSLSSMQLQGALGAPQAANILAPLQPQPQSAVLLQSQRQRVDYEQKRRLLEEELKRTRRVTEQMLKQEQLKDEQRQLLENQQRDLQ